MALMEFLLLLSAMLTALTGAITGVRAPDVPVQQVAGASGSARVAEAVTETLRQPVVPLGASRPNFVDIHLAAAPQATIPLYADRLRE